MSKTSSVPISCVHQTGLVANFLFLINVVSDNLPYQASFNFELPHIGKNLGNLPFSFPIDDAPGPVTQLEPVGFFPLPPQVMVIFFFWLVNVSISSQNLVIRLARSTEKADLVSHRLPSALCKQRHIFCFLRTPRPQSDL